MLFCNHVIEVNYLMNCFFRKSFYCSLLVSLFANTVSAQEFKLPPAVVQVEKATTTNIQASRRYTGLLLSPATVAVTAQVIGEVMETGFTEGGNVEKGQLLYQLDDVKYDAAVKSAEAKVAQGKANLAYASKTYERKKVLFSKNASSAEDFDLATSNLAALKAGLSAAEAELISAQKDLLNTKITAPMAGRIGKNDASVGNYVTPSSGPLTSIVQLDPLRLQVTVSNRDFLEMFGDENGLRNNSIIRIKLADDTWYPYDGEVDFIGNEANRKTDSVWIYVKIKNPDYKLLPGSTVTVMISKKNGPEHVAVSPAAVMYDANGAYVYVVDDQNKANRRDVVTDFSTGEQQVIKSGLEAGEKVVTAGILKIMMPGMEVVPQEKGAEQKGAVPQVADDKQKDVQAVAEEKSSN